MSRIKLAVGAGAAALVCAVVLAACTSGGSRDAGAGKAAKSDIRSGASVDSAAGASAVPGRAAGVPQGRSADVVKTLVTQALIRTADLTVQIAHGRSLATPADQAEQIAIVAGGQVFADERTGGRSPAANITLKVPGDAMGDVVDKLSKLGKEKARRSSTQDVTTQVADVSSRVRSAQAGIAQLRVLFDRAVKIGDLIALENELSQREADLEALEAQQRALDSQTSMATVTLHLTTAGAAAVVQPKHHADGGFVGGLERGWHAFQTAAGGLATGVGAVLPFLVLALVVAAAGVALRRRFRRGGPVRDPAAGEA